MWSDGIAADQLRTAIDLLQPLIPVRRFPNKTWTESCPSRATPEQVAQLLRSQPGFSWLDGADSRHLLFANPLATVRGHDGQTIVENLGNTTRLPIPPLHALAAILTGWKDVRHLKLVGYLAYDLVRDIEDIGPIASPIPAMPDMCFGIYGSELIYDEGWFIAGGENQPDAINHLNCIRTRLLEAETLPQDETVPRPWLPIAVSAADDNRFVNSVDEIVRRIRQGDFFQTNLCRTLSACMPFEQIWSLYLRMRRLNPARFGAYLTIPPDAAVLSMSPELYLQVRNGTVHSHPIKGTRPKLPAQGASHLAQVDLRESSKDSAELAMIVDVVRNDLSRVCEPGSVHVLEHAGLLELPSLYHTYSRISGQLRRDKTTVDLIQASFPPASISGAPKMSAVRAALSEEDSGRGPSMGAIGWIGTDGDLELSVAIRTAFACKDQIRYLAGCGITSDSVAIAELAESEWKAAPFRRAMGSSL